MKLVWTASDKLGGLCYMFLQFIILHNGHLEGYTILYFCNVIRPYCVIIVLCFDENCYTISAAMLCMLN